MDMAYFIINNIKYIYDYNKYRLEIYRLVNNEKYSLTEKEKEYFNNMLKKSNNYIFNIEKIDSIITSNTSIIEDEYIVDLIKFLEGKIPEKYRTNLYENLKTLKIVSVSQDELGNSNVPANYDALTNTISINYNNDVIRNDEFNKKRVILHELMHMASSHYDKENNIIYSGFHKIDLNKEINCCGLALTEGFTEYLAFNSISEPGVMSGVYLIEQKLIEQLSCILGDDVVLDAFYNNNGIDLLKEKLLLLTDDKTKIARIFNNIELDYYCRDDIEKTELLAETQSILVELFDIKCRNLLIDAYSSEEKNKELKGLISRYNTSVIDSELLELFKIDSKKYVGINRSAEIFSNKKSKYDMILPSFHGEYNYTNKRMGYIKVSILAIISMLLCISLLILGIIFM